jgi:glucokinase
MKVLAADVGGTNTRLALIDTDEGGLKVLHSRRYKSREFPALTPIAVSFLEELNTQPTRACFGVAAPVRHGRAAMTNLPWTVDVRALSAAIGLPRTKVVNDLVAAGWGVQRLRPRDLVTLQHGRPLFNVTATRALIGAGTGLGQAYVTWQNDRYVAHGSEGGHATFCPRSEDEWGLVQFLASRFGNASCERVVSGSGLVNIYRYLSTRSGSAGTLSLKDLKSADDPAALITQRALPGTDAVAARTLEMFVSAYGALAGNAALTFMATGGVYLVGGIAPRILTVLRDGTFMRAFLDKGRMSAMLSGVPVHVVINPDVGLIGAGVLASRLL